MDQATIRILQEIIGDIEDVDFVDISSVLFGLFEGIVQPDIFLTFSNKVSLQQIFTVKVRITNRSTIDWMLALILF